MHKAWWKESVVYQIYPRSFCDSNGDGVGDLRGIIGRLDYLQDLGVDVVWLSPVYKSPNDDNGYDISDYRDIMAEFGTLADWDELLAAMHGRGIRLVMDLVVNHTSDEHPWFVESRKSKDNPYRDFYIWRPRVGGHEPNNWKAHFSPSAWEYDAMTGEYYLHLFTKKQPDLNWENPRVRREVYDMMEWWLQRGIDGFRLDVANMYSKEPGLPDAPVISTASRYQPANHLFTNGPRLLEFLGEMRREVFSKYDILTVGETPDVGPEEVTVLTNDDTGPFSMVFQFEHMHIDAGQAGRWRLADLKQVMTRWQLGLEGRGWNSIYLGNHDQPRAVSRFGDDGRYRVESAKLLATMLLTLQGTPYIYQGDEIGMTNVAFESLGDYRDVATFNLYRELTQDLGYDARSAQAVIQGRSRDNARTPVQWDATEHAGFTSGAPWIRVNPNYREINVEQARADPGSIYYFYRELIRLRRANPVAVYGRYDLLLDDHPQIYAYTRTLEDDKLLVLLNFSAEMASCEFPEGLDLDEAELLAGNYADSRTEKTPKPVLRPWESRVYRLR